jgi:hypothetical protein
MKRRDLLKLFGVSPLIAGAVAADVLAQPAKPPGPPPLYVAKVPRDSTHAERAELLAAMERLGSGHHVVLEQGYDIQVVHPSEPGTVPFTFEGRVVGVVENMRGDGDVRFRIDCPDARAKIEAAQNVLLPEFGWLTDNPAMRKWIGDGEAARRAWLGTTEDA